MKGKCSSLMVMCNNKCAQNGLGTHCKKNKVLHYKDKSQIIIGGRKCCLDDEKWKPGVQLNAKSQDISHFKIQNFFKCTHYFISILKYSAMHYWE